MKGPAAQPSLDRALAVRASLAALSEEGGAPALTERMQRQIDRLLDEADEAARVGDWAT